MTTLNYSNKQQQSKINQTPFRRDFKLNTILMKKLVFVLTITLFLICSAWIITTQTNVLSFRIQTFFTEYIPRFSLVYFEKSKQNIHEPQITPIDLVWDMLTEVNHERVLSDLRRLTGEEPVCLSYGCFTITHRLTGSQGLDWAQDYLFENLINMGYEVEYNDWSSSGLADQNLIARKKGVLSPNEEVYFVAHVDGARTYDNNFPAADDNASSVVNGLELARILSYYDFDRTLVLFFSSGEEQGFQGVKAYLNQLLPEELGAIKYVVNRDMTGYDGNNDRVMELFHGNHPPSIALTQMMSEIIEVYQLNLVPKVVAGCP